MKLHEWLVVVCGWAVLGVWAAPAEPPFEARVLRVVDGDSLWVRARADTPPLRLRLQGLDAPETCQRFGPQAREALSARLVLAGERVWVQKLGRDSYDRWLARVSTGDGDLGAWLVGQGLAWSDGAYRRQESEARRQGLGLFAQAQPERPRDFRRRHGPCGGPWPSHEQRGDAPVFPRFGGPAQRQTAG